MCVVSHTTPASPSSSHAPRRATKTPAGGHTKHREVAPDAATTLSHAAPRDAVTTDTQAEHPAPGAGGTPARAATALSDIVTNLTKLAGIVVVINEVMARGEQPVRPAVLVIAALMLAGAQGVESILDRVLGR